MAQAPMISIPRKATDEVDWTTPIRNLIAQSYGEDPNSYAAECAALQRCRQDAVRGAGSDITARDLLYKYFGQLELLELRFSEIKVNFPWHDAFTSKLITQSSIAYEKASVLFQIAATHSSIAASQSRSDPEGQKRAFYYFRTCAGMLTYINENFLHAPSTDLSRDVIKFLSNVILAQATEVFFEKSTDEKKSAALVAKVASQASSIYNTLCEDVKEFMGKGIFDRNWVTLIQIKAKYFTSLTHYHRALADLAASKHGDALARLTLSENLSKEASRSANSFSSSFLPNLSPTLPADSGATISELVKAHAALVSARRAEAVRENDLIYNAVIPTPETLSTVEKLVVATPVPIHEVYGAADVQKTIGPDIFERLIPLSVHESASVYSEEKAKLVRGEVERCEGAEGERRSVVEGMGVREGLGRFRAMAEGEIGGESEVPTEVREWRDEIKKFEGGSTECVEKKLGELKRLKDDVQIELEIIGRDLEIETRDCEELRVKYEHRWTMEPSAGFSKAHRQDLKEHLVAFEAAGASDAQVAAMWNSVRGEVAVLLNERRLEQMFHEQGGEEIHLLDVDTDGGSEEKEERARIGGYVAEIEERLGRLNVLSRERGVFLKDLKEKVQKDDVSHLLLLNRRNTSVEPALFAAELEKFRPFQQQMAANIQHQATILQEISKLWKGLKEHAGRGPGARKWEERERRKRDLVKRFGNVRDVYMEARDGLAKGLQFYTELTDLTLRLKSDIKEFVTARKTEREGLVAKLETEDRLAAKPPPLPPAASKPPLPPPPPASSAFRGAECAQDGVGNSFAAMNLGQGHGRTPSLPQPPRSPPSSSPSGYPQSYGLPPSAFHQQPRPQQHSYNAQSFGPTTPHSPPFAQQQLQQPFRQLSFPPPPQLPMQPTPTSPTGFAPQNDPYSGLGGMFGNVGSLARPPPSQNAFPNTGSLSTAGVYFPVQPQGPGGTISPYNGTGSGSGSGSYAQLQQGLAQRQGLMGQPPLQQLLHSNRGGMSGFPPPPPSLQHAGFPPPPPQLQPQPQLQPPQQQPQHQYQQQQPQQQPQQQQPQQPQQPYGQGYVGYGR